LRFAASDILALCDFCHAQWLYHSGTNGEATMSMIVSILSRGMAIAIAGAGAFVIANYALDWL
jgi:hypothetical protein